MKRKGYVGIVLLILAVILFLISIPCWTVGGGIARTISSEAGALCSTLSFFTIILFIIGLILLIIGLTGGDQKGTPKIKKEIAHKKQKLTKEELKKKEIEKHVFLPLVLGIILLITFYFAIFGFILIGYAIWYYHKKG